MKAEEKRLEEARTAKKIGNVGVVMSANALGELSAKIIRRTARLGNIFRLSKRIQKRFAGMKTELPESATARQRICFALSLWNGSDPILKERLYGLTGNQGNHGEDVKEYYYYLDNTPTHSYMKFLYKYPQEEFPYENLKARKYRRDKTQARI